MQRIQSSHNGTFAENLVEIATWGVYEAINIRETLGAGGRIPVVSYPQLRPEFPRLRVTLHTDSLVQVQDEEVQACDWLVRVGTLVPMQEERSLLDLLVTPARSNQDTVWPSSPVALASYKSEELSVPLRHLYERSLASNWEETRQVYEPSAALLDARIHEALRRHLFVTLDQSVLNQALTPRPDGNLFVLTPLEAQRYIDLCLKAHGRYHIRSHYTTSRSFYYWERLWQLVPSFQVAWPYVVYGAAAGIPGSAALRDFMQALSARLIGQMQAYDRISWLRYSFPTSDARDEMLNQLNYFFMLATGLFDSLAWLCFHRFGLRGDRRDVTLRAERRPGRDNRIFQQLDMVASALASFLRDRRQQDHIDLFYEPRDRVQHRLVLTGAHFNTGQIISDCNVAFLTNDEAQPIQAVDHFTPENRPFTEWGLLRLSSLPEKVLLEPSRFTLSALRFVFPFVDEVLRLLNFAGWIGTQPDLQAAADQAMTIARAQHRVQFEVAYP